MPRKTKSEGDEEERTTITLPGPESRIALLAERLQAKLAAAGYPPEMVKINAVRKGKMSDGKDSMELEVRWAMTPKQMERFNKLFDIKIFDPGKDKDTVSIGNGEVRRMPSPDTEKDVEQKAWTRKERRRRSKPKETDGPDLT